MDVGSYFQLIIYTSMAATFIVLALAFLDLYYGKEEEKQE